MNVCQLVSVELAHEKFRNVKRQDAYTVVNLCYKDETHFYFVQILFGIELKKVFTMKLEVRKVL
jgi:hypothetical protein